MMATVAHPQPKFFLSSSEYETWRTVRTCYVLGRLKGPRRRGYWWVRVDPAVPGSLCGFTADQDELVLAERYESQDIEQLSDEPILVYVCRIKHRNAVVSGTITEQDVELVAWAEVARRPDLLPAAG